MLPVAITQSLGYEMGKKASARYGEYYKDYFCNAPTDTFF